METALLFIIQIAIGHIRLHIIKVAKGNIPGKTTKTGHANKIV